MSNRREVFECHWRPSRRLQWLWGGCLLVALGALASSGLGYVEKIILSTLLVLHSYLSWRKDVCFLTAQAPRALRLSASGWHILQGGHWHSVRIQASSVVHPLLIVVHYRAETHSFSRSLCLPADSLDADTHRRLRVRLRFAYHVVGK